MANQPRIWFFRIALLATAAAIGVVAYNFIAALVASVAEVMAAD